MNNTDKISDRTHLAALTQGVEIDMTATVLRRRIADAAIRTAKALAEGVALRNPRPTDFACAKYTTSALTEAYASYVGLGVSPIKYLREQWPNNGSAVRTTVNAETDALEAELHEAGVLS